MKVIPFKVPQTRREAFRIQTDRLPHFYDKLHQHHETQIMWIEQSEGTLIAGDYVGRFEPGDVYIIASDQAHVFRNDDSFYTDGRYIQAKSLSIYFDETYFGETFWQLEELESVRRFFQEASRSYKVIGPDKERAKSTINLMISQQGPEKIISFLSLLKLLADSCDLQPLSVTASMETYSHNEGRRMNDILQFTFRESHRKIYIDEIAKIAHLSPEAFCRYFKTRTGKTFTNFLNEVRVSNACKLIINRDFSVSDVCYKSGFSNVSNFNRAFKKVTGKTPSKYVTKINS